MSTTKRGRHAVASRIRAAGHYANGLGGLGGLGGIERHTDRPMNTNGHISPLTPRQAQVLAMYDAGKTRSAIARELGVRSIAIVLDMALLKAGR